MDKIFTFLLFFLVAWCVAAWTDVWPRDQVRVFGMSRQTDRDTGQLREWRVEAPKTYRVEGQLVLSNVGGISSRFEHCEVFDLRNWNCTYADGSGRFWMMEGWYGETPYSGDIFPGYEWMTVSELAYHLERCQRAVDDSFIAALFQCALGPFLD